MIGRPVRGCTRTETIRGPGVSGSHKGMWCLLTMSRPPQLIGMTRHARMQPRARACESRQQPASAGSLAHPALSGAAAQERGARLGRQAVARPGLQVRQALRIRRRARGPAAGRRGAAALGFPPARQAGAGDAGRWPAKPVYRGPCCSPSMRWGALSRQRVATCDQRCHAARAAASAARWACMPSTCELLFQRTAAAQASLGGCAVRQPGRGGHAACGLQQPPARPPRGRAAQGKGAVPVRQAGHGAGRALFIVAVLGPDLPAMAICPPGVAGVGSAACRVCRALIKGSLPCKRASQRIYQELPPGWRVELGAWRRRRTQLSACADTRRSASSQTALAAALPSAAMSAMTGASHTRTSRVRLRTCRRARWP